MKELPDLSVPNPEHEEHSRAAKAKRVTAGAMPLKFNPNTGVSVQAEAQEAPGTDLTLTTGKAYRVISDGDFHLKVGAAGVAATVQDMYVAAGQEVLIRMVGNANTISTFAGAAAGSFVQAVEVQ